MGSVVTWMVAWAPWEGSASRDSLRSSGQGHPHLKSSAWGTCWGGERSAEGAVALWLCCPGPGGDSSWTRPVLEPLAQPRFCGAQGLRSENGTGAPRCRVARSAQSKSSFGIHAAFSSLFAGLLGTPGWPEFKCY